MTATHPILFTIFLIFTGAAVLATIALYARQALLIVYIVLGIALGSSGFKIVDDPVFIKEIAHVGIMFLLFLLGLNLPSQKLIQLVKETTIVTGLSALAFFANGFAVAWLFDFTLMECVVIGIATMFSSTIIGLKLLPTTILHHRRSGEIIISILLLQDLLAIIALLFLQSVHQLTIPLAELVMIFLTLGGLTVFCALFMRFILTRLLERFDKIPEYIFVLTIGWCLGVAQLAQSLGLTYAVGAFIAGVAMASHPISLYIAEILKPLRDFFLILFFFSLGASLNVSAAYSVLLPALILALTTMLFKPVSFHMLLKRTADASVNSMEIGVRLGQLSEFSLLIAVLAYESQIISELAAYVIQIATMLTFIASSYWIVMHYPTPVAVSDALRRD